MEPLTLSILTELAPLITGRVIPFILDRIEAKNNSEIDRVRRNADAARAFAEWLEKAKQGEA